MSSTKPLDIAILSKVQDGGTEDIWKPYQEYGEKTITSTNGWSCFILAEEGELFSIRCANTTEKLLAVRISVDACYVQQYLLHPKGEEGDTVTCCGAGSHLMMFHLVSALIRVGNKRSRPPSETGCINVTVYEPMGSGSGLPPPEKPTEELELPVSMDGTFWKLCVRLTGDGVVFGEPSPHALVIGGLHWVRFASLDFNYRTEDELFSGRIRGISLPDAFADTSTVSPPGKRKRPSLGDVASKKRRDQPSLSTRALRFVYVDPRKDKGPMPSTSNRRRGSTSTVSAAATMKIEPVPVPSEALTDSAKPSLNGESSPVSPDPKPDWGVVMADLESSDPFIPWPLDRTPQPDSNTSSSNPPVIRAVEPQPLPHPSLVAPTITPPPTPHDNPGLDQPTTASTSETDRATPTLTSLLDEFKPIPLGFLVKDLQEAGILTVAGLKVIAPKPEAFRAKVPALADLRERNEFLWMALRLGLGKLLKDDQRERSACNLVLESDPVGKFVRSLGAGECIDLDAFANGLRAAGISSERDLLVISRNLERYTENIPFLREFAASEKFGWAIFQVGLEDLPGQKTITPAQVQDDGTNEEGRAYIKGFLDNIDPEKPLGHLVDGFIKAGLTDRVRLHCVAENLELALDAMPFIQGLAAGDQLVWAMILVGLGDLATSV